MLNKKIMGTALGLACVAGTAFAGPVRLNEFSVNPDGSDARRQFIELQGCSGQSLDGMAIVAINSYYDEDEEEYVSEIDESFIFGSKYQVHSSGYFVLWNANSNSTTPSDQRSNSDIYGQLPAALSQSGLSALAFNAAGTRYEASFEEVRNVPSGETAGDIKNNGSVTILLIDWAASMAANGNLTAASIAKDIDPDTNDDGELDGDLQDLVVMDEISWSHDGGFEFTFDEENEWDFAAGWNPECGSRCNDITTATTAGSMISDGSNSDDFRRIYANWNFHEVAAWPGVGIDGFGCVPENPGATVTVDDSSGTPGASDYGSAGISQTPGRSNDYNSNPIAQPGLSCRIANPDTNNDGAVDLRDLAEAARQGDAELVRNVLNSLR